MSSNQDTHERVKRAFERRLEQGRVGYALLWLLGVPLPVLLLLYFIRG